jgi:hypothetical protein
MATLRKSDHSPFWHAVFRVDKRQTNRSTKVLAKLELKGMAQERADLLEQEQVSKAYLPSKR